MSEEFEGFKVIKEEEDTIEEQAGRPKLVKYTIKQNHSKWSVKNEETKKVYYIKMDKSYPMDSLHAFLASIKAYEAEKRTKTELPVDYSLIARNIIKNKKMTIWVPINRENIIKQVWNINSYMNNESKITTFKEYIKK